MKVKTGTTITFSPKDVQDILIRHIRKMYPEGDVAIEFKVAQENQEGDYRAALPLIPVFKGAIAKVAHD